MVANSTVLIVEDEENLREAVKYNLEKEGFAILSAGDGAIGLEMAQKFNPSLVILDLMLPSLDGLQVCQRLRQESDIPIIMLTAKADEIDRVIGLELGADDYVTKPFSMRELLARVKSLLRRSRHSPSDSPTTPLELITSDNLQIDTGSHQVTLEGEPLYLTPKEFELLKLLVTNKGRAFGREQIIQNLWGYDYVGNTRTVDVHIRWLREKIEINPSNPKRIITLRGIGYRFQE